jgi:hypothetical protein
MKAPGPGVVKVSPVSKATAAARPQVRTAVAAHVLRLSGFSGSGRSGSGLRS